MFKAIATRHSSSQSINEAKFFQRPSITFHPDQKRARANVIEICLFRSKTTKIHSAPRFSKSKAKRHTPKVFPIQNKCTRDGTRTHNLLLRREAPYPLGHTSVTSPTSPARNRRAQMCAPLTAVGFEPTQIALVELESTPLDHSGKLSLDHTF